MKKKLKKGERYHWKNGGIEDICELVTGEDKIGAAKCKILFSQSKYTALNKIVYYGFYSGKSLLTGWYKLYGQEAEIPQKE